MNIILTNEFSDKLILDEDKSKIRIEYSHGMVSDGFVKHPKFKYMFVKDTCPGSNTNEEISLSLNLSFGGTMGVVWSTGCGYSGTMSVYSIPDKLWETVKKYFNS